MGSSPYPSVPVEKLFSFLNEGHRMEKPPRASDDVYASFHTIAIIYVCLSVCHCLYFVVNVSLLIMLYYLFFATLL